MSPNKLILEIYCTTVLKASSWPGYSCMIVFGKDVDLKLEDLSFCFYIKFGIFFYYYSKIKTFIFILFLFFLK